MEEMRKMDGRYTILDKRNFRTFSHFLKIPSKTDQNTIYIQFTLDTCYCSLFLKKWFQDLLVSFSHVENMFFQKMNTVFDKCFEAIFSWRPLLVICQIATILICNLTSKWVPGLFSGRSECSRQSASGKK